MSSGVLAEGLSANRAYRMGLLMMAGAMLIWSTAGLFVRGLSLDSWTILAWRGVFGAATCLAFLYWQEGRNTWRAFRGMGARDWAFVVATAASMVLYVHALKLTTIAHVTIIYAALPFIAAFLARLVLRERTSRATLLASAAAMAGIVITVVHGAGGQSTLLGDLLAFAMTVLGAGMIVIVRGQKTVVPMIPAACLSCLLGSAMALPFASTTLPSPGEMVLLMGFGISFLGIGLILFVNAARLLPPADGALIGALDAPLACLWVYLAFAELPNAWTIVGGAIVVIAVVGHILLENRSPRR
ncbi:DMT family transporter [Zavarzinia sp. CC-PAN008]|uniref:DMT family transporter n=1 Tax=Zavarzinia sp. CC-PAN008 TaxID=3243332 RepID=UPI003F744735